MNINAISSYANYSSKARQTNFNGAEKLSNEEKKALIKEIGEQLCRMRNQAIDEINVGYMDRIPAKVTNGTGKIISTVNSVRKSLQMLLESI